MTELFKLLLTHQQDKIKIVAAGLKVFSSSVDEKLQRNRNW